MAVPALIAALALLFVPWGSQPFSLPKLLLLATGALGLALHALRKPGTAPPAARFLGLSWLALLALSAPRGTPQAVLLDGSAALLFLALLHQKIDPEKLGQAVGITGGIIAAVVLVQFVHFLEKSPLRLRMFGTLGNPDFCAAWLTAALFLTRRKWLQALQLAALAALGSYATLLALGAGLLLLRPKRPLLAAAALALVFAGASGRNLATRITGRLELHSQAAEQLLEHPLLGAGPGSHPAHVHDDFLERALDQGWPAAAVMLALCALALRKARDRAAAAALASLCARAFVDFPLSRPAELSLFVTLLALCFQQEPTECPASPSPPPSSSLAPPLLPATRPG